MAAGTPVVVSPNGALPEVVGDAGVITRECTAEAFAATIADLLADASRCKALARAGKKRASVFYSYTKQTDKILAILEEVASGER
jgi:glycosyltransferase involved in cell wall biosynthesis